MKNKRIRLLFKYNLKSTKSTIKVGAVTCISWKLLMKTYQRIADHWQKSIWFLNSVN